MRSTPISPGDTAAALHTRLAEIAADMLPQIVEDLLAGMALAVSQPAEGIIYASKLEGAEGAIDFGQPADQLARKLRALNPRPGTWCIARGERLMLLAGEAVDGGGPPGTVIELPLTVACGEGALRLTRVQRPGRKAMGADELQRGFPLPLGTVLA
jgi:methionyl-tRNA formyltransferase